MSGAKVGLVLGLISSTITVIETCKTIYGAAHDTEGLPEAFRKVSENIPLVLDILGAVEKLQEKAEEDFQKSNDAAEKQSIEDTSKVVRPVMQDGGRYLPFPLAICSANWYRTSTSICLGN
jgi:hypothetical protein